MGVKFEYAKNLFENKEESLERELDPDSQDLRDKVNQHKQVIDKTIEDLSIRFKEMERKEKKVEKVPIHFSIPNTIKLICEESAILDTVADELISATKLLRKKAAGMMHKKIAMLEKEGLDLSEGKLKRLHSGTPHDISSPVDRKVVSEQFEQLRKKLPLRAKSSGEVETFREISTRSPSAKSPQKSPSHFDKIDKLREKYVPLSPQSSFIKSTEISPIPEKKKEKGFGVSFVYDSSEEDLKGDEEEEEEEEEGKEAKLFEPAKRADGEEFQFGKGTFAVGKGAQNGKESFKSVLGNSLAEPFGGESDLSKSEWKPSWTSFGVSLKDKANNDKEDKVDSALKKSKSFSGNSDLTASKKKHVTFQEPEDEREREEDSQQEEGECSQEEGGEQVSKKIQQKMYAGFEKGISFDLGNTTVENAKPIESKPIVGNLYDRFAQAEENEKKEVKNLAKSNSDVFGNLAKDTQSVLEKNEPPPPKLDSDPFTTLGKNTETVFNTDISNFAEDKSGLKTEGNLFGNFNIGNNDSAATSGSKTEDKESPPVVWNTPTTDFSWPKDNTPNPFAENKAPVNSFEIKTEPFASTSPNFGTNTNTNPFPTWPAPTSSATSTDSFNTKSDNVWGKGASTVDWGTMPNVGTSNTANFFTNSQPTNPANFSFGQTSNFPAFDTQSTFVAPNTVFGSGISSQGFSGFAELSNAWPANFSSPKAPEFSNFRG